MFQNLHLGAEIEILRKSKFISRGKLRWKGHLRNKYGTWIGVELNVSDGKNDGTHCGKKYFACKDLHGLFVRAWKVRFPIQLEKRTNGIRKFKLYIKTRH